MSVKELFRLGAEIAVDKSKEAALAALATRFPGITFEALRQGWIPLSQQALQGALQRATRDVRNIESVQLLCATDKLILDVDTSAFWLVKNRLRIETGLSELELNKSTQRAAFQCNEEVAVQGRGLIGDLVSTLVECLVQSALRSPRRQSTIRAASKGAVELAWPKIVVHLNEIPQVQWFMGHGVDGLRPLDLLQLGPAEVHERHVRLRLRRVA